MIIKRITRSAIIVEINDVLINVFGINFSNDCASGYSFYKRELHHCLTTLKVFNSEKDAITVLKVFNTEKGLYHLLRTLKVFNVEKELHHFLETLKGFNFEQ